MRRGIIDVIIYYAAAAMITFLSGAFLGWGSGHAPGWWLLILLGFAVIGIGWMIISIFRMLFVRIATDRTRGQVWSHLLIWMAIGIYASAVW
jgi:hypothetical protein